MKDATNENRPSVWRLSLIFHRSSRSRETWSGGRERGRPDGHWRAIRHRPPLTSQDTSNIAAMRLHPINIRKGEVSQACVALSPAPLRPSVIRELPTQA
jgi:hypothetical protein